MKVWKVFAVMFVLVPVFVLNLMAASDAKTVFADAVAVWHMGDMNSADGKSPLALKGDVKVGVELKGDEKAWSISRGGDGRAVEFIGGCLDAGQGGDGLLNLKGSAMTILFRFKNPSGKWLSGELFCKHGGHDNLVYNLFVNGDWLGFEFGAEGKAKLAGSVTVPVNALARGDWHDIIVRYDGRELVMFVDGVKQEGVSVSGMLRQGNKAPAVIGKSSFHGLIDHVALWSRALSENEVIALSGGEKVMQARREALAKTIEAKIGKEGLTLNDQLRGARELRQRLWNDPQRPRYHLMPPDGFWNDINGTIFWKGRYHVFFLGRLAPDRDTILSGKDTDRAREIWLHASSKDLVNWIHHPPAILPVFDGSMPSGIYSGDMINDAPIPTIIVHIPKQGTCIYTAEDDELIRWKPNPNNPVIPSTNAPPEVSVFDPCGWMEGDTYYALIGFRSKDLVKWEYRGPFYKSERRWTEEYMDLACPDFYPLGDKHMLISHVHRPWNHLQYYIGRWDKQNEKFIPESHGFMSWPGGSVCAPETLLDDKGRRIFWGWIMEARPATNGWDSVATLPRVFSLAEDKSLRIEPAQELETLRYNPRQKTNLSVSPDVELKLDDIKGDCLELAVEIEPGDAKEFGVKVRCSPDGAEQTTITCVPQKEALKIELEKSTLDPLVKYSWCSPQFAKDTLKISEEERFAKEQVAPFTLKPGESLKLRIYLDRSVLEVFANGRQCITQRIYPSRPDSLGISLFARGGSVKVKSLNAWDISPANSW
jgi:beta-fructofuranosidase